MRDIDQLKGWCALARDRGIVGFDTETTSLDEMLAEECTPAGLPETVPPLRHALEVRHDSFKDKRFYDLARKYNAAIVYAHDKDFPEIDEPTADFTYARLMQAEEKVKTGYKPAELDKWAKRAKAWAKKGEAFVYFISGAKVRNPAWQTQFLGQQAGLGVRGIDLCKLLGIPDDDREQIVEIMCDAAGEVADGLHLLRLTQGVFDLGPLANLFVDPVLQIFVQFLKRAVQPGIVDRDGGLASKTAQ